MKKWSVVVVGAGPAGLAAACSAVNRKPGSVLVLEGTTAPGQKLLLSGSGQCNLAHGGTREDLLRHYNVAARKFIRPAIFSLDTDRLLGWFSRRGFAFEARRGKEAPFVIAPGFPDAWSDEAIKIFPHGAGAREILACLVDEIGKKGGELWCGYPVRGIEVRDDGFVVTANDGRQIKAAAIVLATGGRSFPATGSDGSGYRLAARLGHTIVPVRPGLTSVRCPEEQLVGMAGVAFERTTVRVRRDGRNVAVGEDALLVTHHGLSGPVILDLSDRILPGDTLVISLLAAVGTGDLLGHWNAVRQTAGETTIGRLIGECHLPKRWNARLLAEAGLVSEDRLAGIAGKKIDKLARAITEWQIPVSAVDGFAGAMVTAGGVALDEVDPRTMASRIVPGLFFAGELLDVNGDCGGYNIHAALAGGFFAGDAAAMHAGPSLDLPGTSSDNQDRSESELL